MAAVDFFLKLDGIDGESVDDKHKGEIEITSWSWGLSQTAHAGGGGGGAGKSVPLDFTFGHRIDKASPKLMLACATGQHIKQATLTCRKAGGQQQEYIKIRLEDCIVSSVALSAHDRDTLPTEQFSLNFVKIDFSYISQNAAGAADFPTETFFDFQKNQGGTVNPPPT